MVRKIASRIRHLIFPERKKEIKTIHSLGYRDDVKWLESGGSEHGIDSSTQSCCPFN